MANRDTYKYYLIRNGKIVYAGITKYPAAADAGSIHPKAGNNRLKKEQHKRPHGQGAGE